MPGRAKSASKAEMSELSASWETHRVAVLGQNVNRAVGSPTF